MHKIYRIADVNANRVREGLRVIEDITRFILDDLYLTSLTKKTRHSVTAILKDSNYIKTRDSKGDVGKFLNTKEECNKNNIKEIAFANIHRVEEGLRVLEEIFKIIDKGKSIKFKNIRFKTYSIEKQLFKKFKHL